MLFNEKDFYKIAGESPDVFSFIAQNTPIKELEGWTFVLDSQNKHESLFLFYNNEVFIIYIFMKGKVSYNAPKDEQIIISIEGSFLNEHITAVSHRLEGTEYKQMIIDSNGEKNNGVYLKNTQIELLVKKEGKESISVNLIKENIIFSVDKTTIIKNLSQEILHKEKKEEPGNEHFNRYIFDNFNINPTHENSYTVKEEGKTPDYRRVVEKSFPSLDEFEKNIDSSFSFLGDQLKIDPTWFNRIRFHLSQPLTVDIRKKLDPIKQSLESRFDQIANLHVEKVVISFSYQNKPLLLEINGLLDRKTKIKIIRAKEGTASPLNESERRELKALKRGGVYAYRIPGLVEGGILRLQKSLGYKLVDPITFTKFELPESQDDYYLRRGSLKSIKRVQGQSQSTPLIGRIKAKFEHGWSIDRLLIIGDLTNIANGAIRPKECLYINAALKYAKKHRLPIDWYSAAVGVQIDLEHGVEGLDASASTLRELCQACLNGDQEINFIIAEANVGAQAYWVAMASILHGTKGITIMTKRGSLALTGPLALTNAILSNLTAEEGLEWSKKLYPEGISTLSGYDLVHGPNGEALLSADSIPDAIDSLLLHTVYSETKEKESVCGPRHPTSETSFLHSEHPELRQAFADFMHKNSGDRNVILDHLRDQNSPLPLSLWKDTQGGMDKCFINGEYPQDASTIVQEMLIGNTPTLVIFPPLGPITPIDSHIIGRAIYKASGRQQVLIIGSLVGFSADPLSMRNRQLTQGALIAKAIIQHKGPILIACIGSMMGGSFVVFSKQLNSNLRILALEGAKLQVIGGRSAARVAFRSTISARAKEQLEKNKNISLEDSYKKEEKRIIEEFNRVHCTERAKQLGCIDAIVSRKNLRENIINFFAKMRKLDQEE